MSLSPKKAETTRPAEESGQENGAEIQRKAKMRDDVATWVNKYLIIYYLPRILKWIRKYLLHLKWEEYIIKFVGNDNASLNEKKK